ncbi:BamA/TamA family outer membrane protein [Sediminitomix flava]|uniref:Surface antigen-like protein n=1 Tax=Sediminitomix flava TaxID=379075 RepID=A0A315ZFY3_SEDFL|nr:BamA/TamA family outer membrane protein [Sediminitomix flava]PWJ44495.1 surface antigen-like protein [Sediminitomix flava]
MKNIFILLFTFLLTNTYLFAQKTEKVEADTVGFINNIVEKTLDLVTVEKGNTTFAAFPTLGYSSAIGLDFGIFGVYSIKPEEDEQSTNSRFHRPTTFVPSISYSTKKQYMFSLDAMIFSKSGWNSMSSFNFLNMPGVYFGIGVQPNEEVQTTLFSSTRYLFMGEINKSINDIYFIGLKYDLSHVHNFNLEGESLQPDITGYDGGWANGLGVTLKRDTRNNTTYPTQGSFWQFSAMKYGKYLGSSYDYETVLFDFRNYFELGDGKNSLAVQAFMQMTFGEVPFYNMPNLGGSKSLRGLVHQSKYIDQHIYYVQTEYRRTLDNRFGVTAFVGTGNTLAHLDDNWTEGMNTVYGLGGRFNLVPKERINFRLDYGRSITGESTLIMTVMEAF